MKINTYFSMLLKKGLSESLLKTYLQKISKLKDTNIDTITDEFHKYLSVVPLDEHFEVIYKHYTTSTTKEIYIKKLSKITGATVRAIDSDYKTFFKLKESQKQREKEKQFPLLLEKTFELGFTPYVGSAYQCEHNVLTFKTDYDDLRLCNIFIPKSKIISEINGKSKTHIKLSMSYKNKIIDMVESSRDLTKPERLSNVFGDYGFIVDSPRASKISKFISDYMLDNQYKIKDEIGRLQTGWNNGVFYIPQRNQDVVWLESNLEKAYVQNGTKQNQEDLLKELAKGKVFINVLGAFASCLYGIVEPMNFFIHNGGLTEGGKSLAVKCALSFFGKPSKMGNNWNATLNGLESYWEQNHSLPMWVDEMEVSSKIENIITAVYTFTDERGKLRAYSQDGDVKQRETKTFRGICFTTGEKSFSEVQNMAKDRVKPRGITRRVLDLNIRELWNNVDMEKVKFLLDNNYGILGIDFIEYLERNAKPIKEDYKNNVSFFSGQIDGEKANQFGILKLTLEILKQMNLVNQYEYDIQLANLKLFASVEANYMNIIKDTFTEFKDKYTEFIMANREHFHFTSQWSVSDENLATKAPFYGKVDLEKNTISLFKQEFQRWCGDNNFVRDQVLETLMDKGCLTVNKGRENYKDCVVRFDKPIKCYQFKNLFENDVEIIYENLKPKNNNETNFTVEKVDEVQDVQNENLFNLPQQKITINLDKVLEEEIPF